MSCEVVRAVLSAYPCFVRFYGRWHGQVQPVGYPFRLSLSQPSVEFFCQRTLSRVMLFVRARSIEVSFTAMYVRQCTDGSDVESPLGQDPLKWPCQLLWNSAQGCTATARRPITTLWASQSLRRSRFGFSSLRHLRHW